MTYQQHMSIYHDIKLPPTETLPSDVNRDELPVIDEIGSYCTVCNETYKNRVSYKSHLCTIHGIYIPKPGFIKAPSRINPNIIPDMNNKDNYCASCHRTYSNRGGYRRHLVKVHIMKKLTIKQEDTN